MSSWTVDSAQRILVDGPVDSLVVDLVSGRLTVVATDGPTRVETTQVRGRPVVVDHHDGLLRLQQRTPRWARLFWWWGRRFRADVSIAVPGQVLADLHLTAGTVVVSGLRGRTGVDVTAGQITLKGLAGRTTATLVSGPVTALDMGGDLTLRTTSGEVVLADSRVERVHASTVSGAITCDLDNARGGDFQLGTTSGSVTVRVRQDSDLTVGLHTTSGRITSSFPQLQPFGRSAPVRDSQGVLGAGLGSLTASSVSGSISLLARPLTTAGDAPAGEHRPGGDRDHREPV